MIDTSFDCPGWSTAVDPRTGRQYFINLIEKTTTWEDPRNRYKQAYNAAIPLQDLSRTLHGSPKNVQVYPTQNYPAQAFQSYPGQSINASPIPSTKTSHHSHTVEMSSLSRSSPHTPRVGSLIKNHQQMLQQQQQQTQETSFSSPSPMETEATVSKINTMFPTASEHHIRLLLKKYHNREAVVISALQVEKHPLTTPGPYTPPVQRSFHTTAMALSAFATPPSSTFGRKSSGVHQLHSDHLTIASSSNGSPIPMRPQSSTSFYTTATSTMYGSPRYGEQHRSSPKPHSSPKMKLRYLKSMFPKAEETVILDVLAMVENNVQKASEQLIRMGYEKKEMTPAPRLSHRKKEEHQPKKEVIQPTPPPKPKSADEKKKLKLRLQGQYKESIPEKIIAMALESVDYSEEKALRILDIVLQEDKDSKKKSEKEKKNKDGEGVEKNVSFKEPNLKNIDLDKAAAIENDETMIINSDHSIITTPIEGPQTSVGKALHSLKVESDEPGTSDTSSSDAAVGDKNKRHRQKARSESNRSEKSATIVTRKEDKSEGKSSGKTVMFEGITDDESFLSLFKAAGAVGPNAGLAKGPNDNILLTDYVTWNGANPDIIKGRRAISNGPNPSMRIDRAFNSRGRSSELCKGPKIGLAKGSMYSQLNRPNVACN